MTVFALLGTFFLGRNVSETVGKEILFIEISDPIILTILISTAIWLICSSIFSIPISTTHATIGSIIGIGLFLGGINGLNWIKIFEMSIWWALSPIIGYVISYGCYKLISELITQRISGLKSFEKIQNIFSYILLVVISLTAFSRAGNDCSNSIGILVGKESLNINLALIITGMGLASGIIVLGRRVIKNVGTLTELYPSTAFSAEIPTSIILLVGTLLGIPLSGSHMLVASLVGLSKARRTRRKRGLWKIILIWIITIPASSLLTILIYNPILFFL
ncbi:MAG: inorganic phosphate transporter [Promethearchaeota archaeon]|nr:MAG: inorganic phosphate transporter [Candidatus Lokiarchaeota archaeon]